METFEERLVQIKRDSLRFYEFMRGMLWANQETIRDWEAKYNTLGKVSWQVQRRGSQ